VLSARDTSRLGGLSGLEVEPGRSGLTFTAVTDDGDLVRWTADDEGRPRGEAVIRPLLDTGGEVPRGKRSRDAEGLTRTDGGYLVSFEGRHRIWRYRGEGARAFARAAEQAAAPVAEGMTDNLGFEALADLRGAAGGALAVGAEDGRLWLCPRAQERCQLALRGSPRFAWWLTGLDNLPGTPDLIGLYRFYHPFTREFRVMLAHLQVRGGRVSVAPLAEIAAPLNVENFEGVAAIQRKEGYRLFILSDNDFAENRRTLLMAFDWKGPPPPPSALPGEGRGPAR
jgi:hypothetical protein